MPIPKFIVESGTDRTFRWAARADQLAVSLFEGGARYTWDDNIKVESKINVREGEWLCRHTDGTWKRAVATAPMAYPAFLDMGAGRTDHEGGIALLMAGVMTVLTNMIGADDTAWLQPQCELVVGALPSGHDFEGSIGLLPLAEAAAGTKYVRAIVQESLGNGMYRIATCCYPADSDDVPTTPTPAPTTAAPTTTP